MLSACLRHRGEIANKTLEAIIYKALTNLLLAAAKKVVLDAVIDRSGDKYGVVVALTMHH